MQSSSSDKDYRVLFVCLGNICRSPAADGAFRSLLEKHKMQERIEVDSAGTAAWHVGKSPDRRSVEAAQMRGHDLSILRARQVCATDFEYFDEILAMDDANLADLRTLCPDNHQSKLKLLLSYSTKFPEREVPDPYYGGADGFVHVLDLVEDACQQLLVTIKSKHSIRPISC